MIPATPPNVRSEMQTTLVTSKTPTKDVRCELQHTIWSIQIPQNAKILFPKSHGRSDNKSSLSGYLPKHL